jgi:hypothetical protein
MGMADTKEIELVAYELTDRSKALALPPVLVGHLTLEATRRVERLYGSVAQLFEIWVTRRRRGHTQRAYHHRSR